MKEGYILKGFDTVNTDENDMELINRYTIKELTADDVMIFKVVLCDNEIDRDFESFSVESLESLSSLFVGKTGITDHSMKSENQLARIFEAKVEKLAPQKNSCNEDYARLVARAYIVKNDKNSGLISDIESGIKKEVSVNCSVEKKICSICGKEYGLCNHIAGNYYDTGIEEKLCYISLNGIKDAYEWSFVAVPAQRNAGVIKGFYNENSKKVVSAEEIISKLKKGISLNLSQDEATILAQKMDQLRYLSEKGKAYEKSLRADFVKTAFEACPDISNSSLASVSEKMDIQELNDFTEALKCLSDKKRHALPQTAPRWAEDKSDNIQFKV